ncbi:dprA-like single stranded DNA binding protein [Mycobacterium phage Kumao]|uniref:DprA-like single stranded DNA binding protein n=1 Tax=Mycobacterium phage Kumao TaxID=2041344 RepID=A0A2D1GPS3_9CAUD|nr:dprA-like single stranded DNA binding protein [Mycobacterium phage Kumao]ATN94046.1 DprA-like single stranded DNA binding protein [Mycobacterium phage Kumao]
MLITGSRRWVARTPIWRVLSHELETHPEGIIVVHGACRGTDDIADRWAWGAKQQGLPVEIEAHPAEWDKYGKRAGVIRNHHMVSLGADICHAFPLKGGTGTRHCMARAIAAGIPVVNHGYAPHLAQAREFVEAYG